jgi:hypothetical protein
MKYFITLILAALIVGFVIFAIAYWVIGKDLSFAVNIGLSGALGGLVVEFGKRYFERRKLKRQ